MRTSTVYTGIFAFAASLMMACGDGSGQNDIKGDSALKKANDSMNAAHQHDPTTSFPQPPVTGTIVDSSRSKDSVKQ